jgi:hypothetical protein
MAPIPVHLPVLKGGTAQSNIAGILPLSSLIELVDVVPKLHSYELSGRLFLWNWPITPHAARLLLSRSKEENEEERNSSCILDKEHTPPLYCIDMRWGDKYTCASPFTVRKAFESARLCKSISATEEPFRLQYLNFIHIYRLDDPPSVKISSNASVTVLNQTTFNNTIPWLAWVGIIVFCGVSGCWFAVAYLISLVMTGWIVRKIFGHSSRQLSFRLKASKLKVDEEKMPKKRFIRCALAADEFNETQWILLYGDSDVVSSFLNLPFRKPRENVPKWAPPTNILRLALYILIAVQWGLILAVSALQDWDAIFISIAIISCVLASAFIYTTKDSIRSWLHDNDIALETVRVAFTGRRSMLSCLVALNPDDKPVAASTPPAPPRERKWINPILAHSNDRRNWEAALDDTIRNGKCVGKDWWVGAIVEGVEKAKEIKEWVRVRQKALDITFENGL